MELFVEVENARLVHRSRCRPVELEHTSSLSSVRLLVDAAALTHGDDDQDGVVVEVEAARLVHLIRCRPVERQLGS